MRLLQWETPQCSLEGIKGCVGSWVSRKLFQSLMVFGKNEAEYAEASVCDLCYRDLWSLEFIVFCCFDVDQVVMDLVHHHQAAVESTILERWPVESAHHICHATGAVVISNNKSSSTDWTCSIFWIFLWVWGSQAEEANSTAGRTKVLYAVSFTCWLQWLRFRERKALILWAFLEMASTWVLKLSWLSRWTPRYLADLFPFQDLAMDGVGCWKDVSPVGDLEDLAFWSVESHTATSLCFPVLKGIEIFLKFLEISTWCYLTVYSILSLANNLIVEDDTHAGRSLMNIRKCRGPKTLPCSTPEVILASELFCPSTRTVCVLA